MNRDVFPLPVAAEVRPAGALAARARKVKERCAALETGDRNNFQLAKELGEELLAAKLDCITEGCGWLAWLKEETGIPQQRASEYMRLAEESRPGGLLPDSGNVGFSEGLRIIRAAAAAKGRGDGGGEPAEEGAGYEDTQEPPGGEDGGNEREEPAGAEDEDDEATSQAAPTEEDGCEGDREPEPGYITLGRWEEAGEELRRTILRVRGDVKFNAQGANENIEWALWSWNPVTGCLHNCPYCLVPETPILHGDMGWRPVGDVRVGDVLVGFDEYPLPGRTRKLRPSVVEGVWHRRQKTYRIVTRHGTVTTTGEHLWLLSGANRWMKTERLQPGHFLRYVGCDGVYPVSPTADYRGGYLAGMTIGDGTFRYLPEQRQNRSAGPQPYWRVALADPPALVRLSDYLAWFDISAPVRAFDSGPNGGPKAMQKVETRAVDAMDFLHRRVQEALSGPDLTIDYCRGVLAGFFDAEGSSGHSANGTSLRMKQKSLPVLHRMREIASRLGFDFKLEQFAGEACSTLRLVGPLRERLRFFGACQPAIVRKSDSVFGLGLDSEPAEVLAVEPGLPLDVVDIRTSTRTFYAAGFATHNCYARDIADRFYEQKFAPSLWPGRLAAPAKTPFPAAKIAAALAEKTPEGDVRAIGLGNVFTCSMADLFGRWVPSVWVEAVLDAVRAAPRWTFLFLTKFPVRMAEFDFPDNVWVGTTVDCQARVKNAEKAFRKVKARVKWLSCEPLIEPLVFQDLAAFHWLVLGGSSRSTQTPEWHPPRSWVNALEAQAAAAGVKVYEKSNLLDRVRQYPGVESAEPAEAPPELRYLPTDGSLQEK